MKNKRIKFIGLLALGIISTFLSTSLDAHWGRWGRWRSYYGPRYAYSGYYRPWRTRWGWRTRRWLPATSYYVSYPSRYIVYYV